MTAAVPAKPDNSEMVDEIARITGGLLTRAMREEIAERLIKMVDDRNRKAALNAIAVVTETLVKDANVSAKKDG